HVAAVLQSARGQPSDRPAARPRDVDRRGDLRRGARAQWQAVMKLAVLNALVSLFVVAVGIAAYHHYVRSPAERIGVIDVTEVYRLKEKEFTDLVTKAGASEADKDKAMVQAEAFARAL